MASTSMSELNKTAQDDETDSCFEFIKRRNLTFKGQSKPLKPEQQLAEIDPSESIKHEPAEVPEIKIVNVKPISQFSASKSPIKAVQALKASPVKHRIDAIAENLKALQQKKHTVPKVAPVAPKVAPVVVKISTSGVVKENKPKSIQLSQKELAHQLILLRCNKKIEFKTALVADQEEKEKSMDDVEMDDDLTNLDWLTTFNLSKNIGFPSKYPLSLSPPNTPSSPISPISSNNNTSLDDDNYDDEADSNHLTAMSINKDHGKWSFVTRILKPWQFNASEQAIGKVSQGAQKPPYSFSCLTFLAIESSQRKRQSVKEIYSWITNNFPYYNSVPSGSWKNSIRHNLSMNKCFSKVDKNLLAMRDFSGKGSLWCTSIEARPILLEIMNAIEKSRSNDLSRLLNTPFLQDINEPVKQTSIISPTPRISKNRSSSSLGSAPMTIINPRLTHKLTFQKNQAITKVSHKSLKPQLNSQLAANQQKTAKSIDKTQENNGITDLDAVNALLSMKSRASSMPSHTTSSSAAIESAASKPGRRKQVFKPPIKKPHINPKLLEKASNVLYYDDIEDEDDDEIEEEYEEDEEEIINELIQDDEFPMSKQRSTKKLQIKFAPFKGHAAKDFSEHIVTMSDDDNDDDDEMEENKLEIDESFQDQNQNCESTDTTINDPLSEESNESNLEPGEIRKSKKPASSKYDINRLLELSRAATLVEDSKETSDSCTSPKRLKLTDSVSVRATRSSTSNSPKASKRKLK